jgi:hypothetical protein
MFFEFTSGAAITEAVVGLRILDMAEHIIDTAWITIAIASF